ncbi:MAG: type III-B CRISPR-associated protein Cas10/Cmr2 [Limnothrix sp.]
MTEKMYTAISFAPVQGFIEKSRKLRDLIGASQILSYLSAYIIAHTDGYSVISPAPIKTSGDEPEKGLPNLIIIKGDQEFKNSQDILLEGWKNLLKACHDYIEKNLSPYNWQCHGWDEAWTNWGNHAWEIFVASDENRQKALDQLEAQKLKRAWTAINWTGESSSLSGQDAICHPRMGLSPYLNETDYIEKFYENLANVTTEHRRGEVIDEDSINKFINTNERLSLPELVKRLATRDEIINELNGLMPNLEQGFRDIIRAPQPPPEKPTPPYRQWTGWFMGDGDGIGDYLKALGQDKQLTQAEQDQSLHDFSHSMRDWGKSFAEEFKIGRVIYAGGDDFFGVIYDQEFNGHKESCITGTTIIDWLMGLKEQWQTPPKVVNDKPVNFSMGFVWAAPSVPQRDILQHCREAEKLAKFKGKDRVTIRVVFNSGQYVQWTCPWDHLWLLTQYCDRQGIQYTGTGQNRELSQYQTIDGKPSKDLPNWGHIYSDLAQLQSRRAIDLEQIEEANDEGIETSIAIALFNLYFNSYGEYLSDHRNHITGSEDGENADLLQWINDLIHIGWQLCDRHTPDLSQTNPPQGVVSNV